MNTKTLSKTLLIALMIFSAVGVFALSLMPCPFYSDVTIAHALEPTPSFEIFLYEGWNLIGLPLIPDDSAIEVVLADILRDVLLVWSYVESTGTWLVYQQHGPPGLTTMVEGEGYWIKMSSSVYLTVHGVEMPPPPALPPTYDLHEGWNLIGFKSLEAKSASTYLGASVAADTVRIYRYIPGAYIGVALSDNLEPGMGYWIAMSDTGTIYP